MKFTIDIQLGNAAMSTDDHVAEAVAEVADAIRSGAEHGKIRDLNGNTVGAWAFYDDPAPETWDVSGTIPKRVDA